MEMVLLTTAQLAKRLGIAAITLQIWRSQGIGIPFVKQGTRVFYRLSDVQDYERRNIDSLSACQRRHPVLDAQSAPGKPCSPMRCAQEKGH
jgi:hypothetical protein